MAFLSSRSLFIKLTNSPGFKTLRQMRYLTSKQLVYSQFGDPLEVVKFKECKVPDLGPTQVLVRMLAAPVNPADINTIQGEYILMIYIAQYNFKLKNNRLFYKVYKYKYFEIGIFL